MCGDHSNWSAALKSYPLFVRGFIRKDGEVWVSVCLDFDLAAQGDTPQEAAEKMAAQIREYVYDAIAGADQDQAEYFLRGRRAPLSQWLVYYGFKALFRLGAFRDGVGRIFSKPLPLPLREPTAI